MPLEANTYLHRIMVKTKGGAERACEQLRDAGYDPIIGDRDEHFGIAIDFVAPLEERCDFLRPHILPPRDD